MHVGGGGGGGGGLRKKRILEEGERENGGRGRELHEVCITYHKHMCVHNECYNLHSINKFQVQSLILAIRKQKISLYM